MENRSINLIQPARLAKSLENQALVYFSGITLAILEPAARKVLIEAVSTARKAGSLIAFDANYRPRLWKSSEEARAAIDEAVSVTDIALPTFPDEQSLGGEEKFRRAKLAFDLKGNKVGTLKTEDIVLLKKLVAKLYGPVVVYRVWQMLDPGER